MRILIPVDAISSRGWEYNLLYVQQPSAGFSMQLSRDVSDFLRFHPEHSGGRHPSNRHLAFLSRVPGILRVLPEALSPWFVALEDERRRLLALGLGEPEPPVLLPPEGGRTPRDHDPPAPGSGIRSTEDTFTWFVPAPEYLRVQGRRPKAPGVGRSVPGWVPPPLRGPGGRAVPLSPGRTGKDRAADRGGGAPAPARGPGTGRPDGPVGRFSRVIRRTDPIHQETGARRSLYGPPELNTYGTAWVEPCPDPGWLHAAQPGSVADG